MRADADLGVLGDRQVGEDLRAVGVLRRRAASTCATRCRRCCRSPRRPLPAWTTMKASTKPLPSLSYGPKLTVGLAATTASWARSRARCRPGRASDPEVAVGVPGEGLGHPERTDDVAVEVDEAVRDLGEVLPDAAVGQHAGREEQVLEVVLGGRHVRVAEVDQDDDDAHGAAEWRPIGGGAADGVERRADRVLVGRDDHAVVEAQCAGVAGNCQHVGDVGIGALAQACEVGDRPPSSWARRPRSPGPRTTTTVTGATCRSASAPPTA